MGSVKISLASTDFDLVGIKNLQTRNLKTNLSSEEKKAEGFLTAEYTMSFLKKINQKSPAVILKKEKVEGYALAVTKELSKEHEVLNQLVVKFEKQKYKDTLLASENYIVVAQLCVDKSFRGMGFVEKMYSFFKSKYFDYKYCVTAVDNKNLRSSKIHKKCGFVKIGEVLIGNSPGEIILWDWNNKKYSRANY